MCKLFYIAYVLFFIGSIFYDMFFSSVHCGGNQGCSAKKKGVGTHPKIAILKQIQTHFKAKH